jgi:hypothetical protein
MMAAHRRSPVDLDAVQRRQCVKCEFTLEHLVVVHAGKGGTMYKPVCQMCGRRGNAISHDVIQRLGINKDSLEVIYNRSCRCERGCSECSPPCQWPGCGTHEMTQLHHFLPKAIYGADLAEQGQTAYYCEQHHHGWHRDVTPHLSRLGAA